LALAEEAVTSVIVAGELRVWIQKNNSDRLERLIATTLIAVPVLPLGPDVADIYGNIRVSLERAGKPIGANDLWIAAHALSLDAIMVTDNVREFERVPGLIVQNWLRE
jgi:tRNA(fMet)-specific endonuclease VapC